MQPEKELSGQTAMVTGGGQGIGAAIILALAQAGAQVAVVDLDLDNARRMALQIEILGVKSLALGADVSDSRQIRTAVDQIVTELGAIDILVNNAGISNPARPFAESSEAEWDRDFDVNLKGPFICTRAVINPMLRRKHGKIVNISSIAGKEGRIGLADYSASKAGVMGFTKTLAREVAPHGLNVNCICPAVTRTAINDTYSQEYIDELTASIPMGRMAEPEEMAAAVLFLVSERSSFINGQSISVDGGVLGY
jgi:NAD(P)-dependent dehydrogenase (short-subunit alcohol dehydrogenase family)